LQPLEGGSFQKVINLPPGGEMHALFVTCVWCFCRKMSIIIGLIKITLKTNVDFPHHRLHRHALDLDSDAEEFNISVLSLLEEEDRYIKNKQ
jgi:hypothetical protein